MEKVKKLTPFDFITSINEQKNNLLNTSVASERIENPDATEKQYVAFMVNRGLSQFQDCAIAANEMNRYAKLPAKMQYDFLRSVIRPKRRFSKWAKKLPTQSNIAVLMEYYSYSQEKALDVYDMFDKEDFKNMKKELEKGGMK